MARLSAAAINRRIRSSTVGNNFSKRRFIASISTISSRVSILKKYGYTYFVTTPKHIFRCDQNGPPARRSEPDWQLEGAYPARYVTDPATAGQPPAHFHRNPLGRGERHAYFGDRTLTPIHSGFPG